jgi:hypothetical protein
MPLLVTGLPERCSFKNNSHTIKELKQEISADVISLTEETLPAVVRNFRRLLYRITKINSVLSEVQLLAFLNNSKQQHKILKVLKCRKLGNALKSLATVSTYNP